VSFPIVFGREAAGELRERLTYFSAIDPEVTRTSTSGAIPLPYDAGLGYMKTLRYSLRIRS
jgi:hypothetical protein